MENIKMKKCSVKLNRLAFYGNRNPAEIQEQILDQRIRRCSVKLQRLTNQELAEMRCSNITCINGVNKMRRCCIRLQRLNLVRSEISSPAASVISSGGILSDLESEDLDFMQQ